MKIQLQKFGSLLTSRDTGKEAFGAFRPSLNHLAPNENIEIDFTDIGTISPSWADEFISKIADEFGDRMILLPTTNMSANSSIKLIELIRGKAFNKVS